MIKPLKPRVTNTDFGPRTLRARIAVWLHKPTGPMATRQHPPKPAKTCRVYCDRSLPAGAGL